MINLGGFTKYQRRLESERDCHSFKQNTNVSSFYCLELTRTFEPKGENLLEGIDKNLQAVIPRIEVEVGSQIFGKSLKEFLMDCAV